MRWSETSRLALTSLMAAVALAACGGGGSDDSTNPPAPVPADTYGVGGEVAGLASGKSLVLQNNGGNDLTLAKNGAFEFSTKLGAGKSYNVTVATQPQQQTCSIINGNGTANATVGNIKVECVDDSADANTSAACFSLERPYAAGSVWTYISATGRTTFEAMGDSIFKGAAVKMLRESSGSNFNRNHFVSTHDGMNYVHGYTGGGGAGTAMFIYEDVLDPQLAVPRALQINTPHTSSYTQIHSDNRGIFESKTAVVQTTTYRGRERISTGFGTFDTCKMEYAEVRNSALSNTRTDWFIASGKFTGLVAQSLSAGQTTQPTRIEVNWD